MTAKFRTRLLGIGLSVVLLVISALLWIGSGGNDLSAANGPGDGSASIPQETLDAIRSLKDLTKSPDNDKRKQGRKKIYDMLSDKPDVRLIPVITAFKDGKLLLVGDHFATVGDRVKVPGVNEEVLPLIDLLTGQKINGPDGKMMYLPKLSGAIGAPYREKAQLAELLSGLSLSNPDPKARLVSIRDVSERAAKAFVDKANQVRFRDALESASKMLGTEKVPDAAVPLVKPAQAAIATALADKPKELTDSVPPKSDTLAVIAAVQQIRAIIDPQGDGSAPPLSPTTLPAGTKPMDVSLLAGVLRKLSFAGRDYSDALDKQEDATKPLPIFASSLKKQLDKDPKSQFADAIKEALASTDVVLGDHAARMTAVKTLGDIGTTRAQNVLQRLLDSATQLGDKELVDATAPALSKADRRQLVVGFVQNTFFGLSSGSILVLLALGLSIIFGLMGVINMAHGEFMMIGAFTTYVVSEGFKLLPPGLYSYYLIAAIPAAFLVAGLCGLLCEYLVIRHLYGRPLETLLATFGVGLVIIWAVRKKFGDSVSVTPPRWMEGDIEIVPDLNLQLNRIYIIIYCAICISVVYFIVNRTKLGLLLRATTQNRDMASALGVATRRIDGITFAIGAGLAGLAGVAVPLYNKINPQVGQEYIVDSFMVVVVGGVGKLAGAIWAGFGLGFITKYLEPILQNIKALASGASVFGRVLVLMMIVIFLQFRPSGLFPPKGRNADA